MNIAKTRPDIIVSIAIGLLIITALMIGFYVHRTISQIRAGLPEEALSHQQAIFIILDDLAQLLRTADTAQTAPQITSTEDLSAQVETVYGRVQALRKDYSFDFLYGAAAIHAIVNPALQDGKRWLKEGLDTYGPESVIVKEVFFLRIQDVYHQVRALLQNTHLMAQQAVVLERVNLERFRVGVILVSGFFLLLLVGSLTLYWQLRRTVAQADRLQQHLAESIENLPEGIALFDHRHKLLVSNLLFRKLFALDSASLSYPLSREAIFRSGIERHIIKAVNKDSDPATIEQLLLTATPYQTFEIELFDGRHIKLTEHPTRRKGLVGIFTDITPFKQTQSLLEHMATHDPLTDLPSRRLLQERLEAALANCRFNQQGLAVMFIDLDYFKHINDSYGHTKGDQLLQQIAQNLRACFRATDIVARFGGDEFVVLLEGVENEAKLADFARRILKTLQNLTTNLIEAPLGISASIGIVTSHGGRESSSELLRRADVACYQAKASGRNNYQFYRSQDDK